MSLKELIKNEIDKLPESLLLEVFNFIQFIENKNERALLVKAYKKISNASFQKIWDNEEYDVYDSL